MILSFLADSTPTTFVGHGTMVQYTMADTPIKTLELYYPMSQVYD